MCGIAGIIAPDVKRFGTALESMTDALVHRGPDGGATHFFSSCGLGHRRLAIVDIAGGAQPMLSPDGQIAVVLNGELYGYKELRNNLEYPFRTESDTEVLLALYDRYGIDMVKHVPGMFAFALWDERRKLLLCARDRFGEKPFFYTQLPSGEFLFASEIKSLLASGLLPAMPLDYASLGHYLKQLYVPVDRTIFKPIKPLLPAHQLIWAQGHFAISSFWELPKPQHSTSLAKASEEFEELFCKAVSKQLVADVEVGAFLSGGLDSTSVVCAATRTKSDIRTFAYGFTDGVDERPYARDAAQMYATRHVEMHDENIDLPALLLRMAEIYDEPFADSSNIPSYLISKQAAQYTKVVLVGDGGDELLAGYDDTYRDFMRRTGPSAVRAKLAVRNFVRCFKQLARFRLRAGFKSLCSGLQLYQPLDNIAQVRYSHGYFSDYELGTHLKPPQPYLPSLYGGADDALRVDIKNYMPADILVKTDRASMANALELRSPFLDVDVASFLISLPISLKIDDTHSKLILREAFGCKWPKSIYQRGKHGFGAPVHFWLQQPVMKRFCSEYFAKHRLIHHVLPPAFVAAYACTCNYQTWALLVLSLWLERYGKYIRLQ